MCFKNFLNFEYKFIIEDQCKLKIKALENDDGGKCISFKFCEYLKIFEWLDT